jgi:hypothetical protein
MQRAVSVDIFHKAFVDQKLTGRDQNAGWVEELGMKKEHETRSVFGVNPNVDMYNSPAIIC